ncbi:MAG: GAF domain-containing protein [Ignavibacteriae bacterium]|nr:GAF domain-containing protein [Ignavibacteriota bacterium]
MDQQSILALQSNNLLKNADISRLNLENINGKLHSINGGEILYREGDEANSVFLIVNGEINLLKKKSDSKSKSIVYADNEFFGAKELFNNINRCSTTVSLTDSYLIELTKDEIEYLIKQDEKIAINIKDRDSDLEIDKKYNHIMEKGSLNDFDEDSDILDDFINEYNIDEIINEIDEQENIILNNFNDFEENNYEKNIETSIKKEETSDNRLNSSNSNQKTNKNEKQMETMNISTEKEFMTSEQFEMVVKALQLVNANVKQDDVLKNIVDVAVDLTNADRGTLYLVDKKQNEIWSKILISNEIEEIRLKIGEGLAGYVAETGEILNIKDVRADNRFQSTFDEITGYTTKNMLVFPIKDKKEDIVGVLQLLNSANGEFSDQEKMFLNAISLNVSFALENASLVEQLLKTERGNSMGKMGNFIAHDLKKPILVSKRYAEHLQKKDLPMDVKQVINLMLEQLTQVANQVAATADYTEGTTILRRQAVSLNDTLRDFALEIHSFVKTKNCKIEYSLSDDVNVYLDKKEFYQCYFNIVKNACEALPEGGNVFVVTEKNEDRIEISFEDRGIGIENSDLKHVFEPLWTKNKLNNSGLGLSISQKIIEDHEGSITIKSEKNEGTNVIISLPIH